MSKRRAVRDFVQQLMIKVDTLLLPTEANSDRVTLGPMLLIGRGNGKLDVEFQAHHRTYNFWEAYNRAPSPIGRR